MTALTLSRRMIADGTPRATLVLLPSLGTTTHSWSHLLAALPSRDSLDVLLFDLPGHGLAAPQSGFTLTELAVGTADVIVDAERGAPIVVAGVSMGGAVAVELARIRPDVVAGVASFNSGVRFGTPEGWEQIIAAVLDSGTAAHDIAGTREAWFTAEFADGRAGTAIADVVLADLPVIDCDSYIACCRALAEYDAESEHRRVRVPGLVVAGVGDRSTPSADTRKVAELGAEIRYAELSGAHLTIVENAADAAVLLDDLIANVVERKQTVWSGRRR